MQLPCGLPCPHGFMLEQEWRSPYGLRRFLDGELLCWKRWFMCHGLQTCSEHQSQTQESCVMAIEVVPPIPSKCL